MTLVYRFSDPDLNLTLELFLHRLSSLLQERLVSVVLYGSVVFDDLAPGYGDLDYLAVLDLDLSDEVCQQLVELRKPLKSGDCGLLAAMLEGAFLPRHMLDPKCTGRALWWGTSGERTWVSNELGWIALHVVRERGILIWGEDVRDEIPPVTRQQLVQQVRGFCRSLEAHGQAGGLHDVDWLLTAARELLLLREGRLSSKSEAADWGDEHVEGEWRR
jgi:hypothetical protein